MKANTYNHTRGDSPLYPCPICREALLEELRKEQPNITRLVSYDEVEAAGYNMRVLGCGPFVSITEDHGNGPKEVWRFPQKRMARWIADKMQASHNYHWMQRHETNNPCPNLNSMAQAYAREEFSTEDYMQFYRDIGYSLSGFADIFDKEEDIDL